MGNDELLTSDQAASLLAVTPSSVERWADRGILPCPKTPGQHRRFRLSDVAAFGKRFDAVPPANQDGLGDRLDVDARVEAPPGATRMQSFRDFYVLLVALEARAERN